MSSPSLARRSFRSLLATDDEPEMLAFDVDGRECKVWLRPLDAAALLKLEELQEAGATAEGGRFLLSRTVVRWEVWHRAVLPTGLPGDWQQSVSPTTEAERVVFAESFFPKLTGEVFKFIADECLRVNGHREEDRGNSPTPSAS